MLGRLPCSPLRRYESSLIRFTENTDTLPTLQYIEHLSIQGCPSPEIQGRTLYRAVDPASIPVLLSRIENLSMLTLWLMDWPRGGLEERKRRRKSMSTSVVLRILSTRLPSLSSCVRC